MASARAGDPPAPAGDSIAAAKKDLASIKSAASRVEPVPGIPGIDVKDDGPAPGGARAEAPALLPAGARPAADPSGKNGGAGNWLVDAMEQRPDHPQSAPGKEVLIWGDKGAKPAEPGDKAASRALAESAYNPLDAFMNGWISAQDRELLLPPARAENPMGADQAGSRAETLPGIDLAPRGASGGGVLAARGAGPADLKAAANPYIADLNLMSTAPMKPFSAADLPGMAPLGPLDLSRGNLPAGADPKSLDGSKSLIPEFAQPPDDDKYFKQIKRF